MPNGSANSPELNWMLKLQVSLEVPLNLENIEDGGFMSVDRRWLNQGRNERSAVGRTLGQLFKVKTEEPERSVLLNHCARVRAGVTTKVFSVSVGFCAA